MSKVRFTVVCFWVLVFPEVSLAHSSIEGIGNFYNGLLHPVLVPAHLLLLVAVGLFFGQQGPRKIQSAYGIFTFSTIVGLTAAWFSIVSDGQAYILVLSAILGLLIALAPRVALLWCGIVALLAGFLVGVDSMQETLSGKDKLITLFGNGVAIAVLVLYAMLLADFFNKNAWMKIGIRIMGSWIAASALLVLAFTFSPRQ